MKNHNFLGIYLGVFETELVQRVTSESVVKSEIAKCLREVILGGKRLGEKETSVRHCIVVRGRSETVVCGY